MSTLHSLEIFVSVYTTKNITETAKSFYCSQPSVSRCIKDLEEEYHVPLFERYHHKLLPTSFADTLYTHASNVLNSYTNLQHAMLTHNERLRIGSTVTISNSILPLFLKQYQAKYPSIRLEVTVSNGASIYQGILDNTLDIALIENEVDTLEVNATPFDKDEMVLLVPNDHPFSKKKSILLEDLDHIPFLHREHGSAVRQYLDTIFDTYHIQVDTLWESRSTHALINAVENGLGVTILPMKMCEKDIKDHRISVVTIDNISLERNYYLTYAKEKKLTSSLVSFIDLCLSHHS